MIRSVKRSLLNGTCIQQKLQMATFMARNMAMGQSPVPPVNIPIPTKQVLEWVVHLPENGIPLVLTTTAISRDAVAPIWTHASCPLAFETGTRNCGCRSSADCHVRVGILVVVRSDFADCILQDAVCSCHVFLDRLDVLPRLPDTDSGTGLSELAVLRVLFCAKVEMKRERSTRTINLSEQQTTITAGVLITPCPRTTIALNKGGSHLICPGNRSGQSNSRQ